MKVETFTDINCFFDAFEEGINEPKAAGGKIRFRKITLDVESLIKLIQLI